VKHVLNTVCEIIVLNSKYFHKGIIFRVGSIVSNMRPCIRQVMTEERLEEISATMEAA